MSAYTQEAIHALVIIMSDRFHSTIQSNRATSDGNKECQNDFTLST